MDNRKNKNQSGFTLVEIIVAVAIIAILAAAAVYGLRAPTEDVDAARLRSVAAEICDSANNYNAFQNNDGRGILTETKLRSVLTGTPNPGFFTKEDFTDSEGNEVWTLNVGLSQAQGDDFTHYWLITLPMDDWKGALDYVVFDPSQFMFETVYDKREPIV